MSAGTTPDFMIGSHYTANCVSRFGAQDMIGNISEFVSDYWSCNALGSVCTGQSKDLTFTEQYNFDGLTGPGGTANGQTGPNYTLAFNLGTPVYGANYFSVPLGLTMMTNDGTNAISIANVLPQDFNSQQAPRTGYWAGSAQSTMFVGGGANGYGTLAGRFSFMNYYDGNSWYGSRCVLPAE